MFHNDTYFPHRQGAFLNFLLSKSYSMGHVTLLLSSHPEAVLRDVTKQVQFLFARMSTYLANQKTDAHLTDAQHLLAVSGDAIDANRDAKISCRHVADALARTCAQHGLCRDNVVANVATWRRMLAKHRTTLFALYNDARAHCRTLT